MWHVSYSLEARRILIEQTLEPDDLSRCMEEFDLLLRYRDDNIEREKGSEYKRSGKKSWGTHGLPTPYGHTMDHCCFAGHGGFLCAGMAGLIAFADSLMELGTLSERQTNFRNSAEFIMFSTKVPSFVTA